MQAPETLYENLINFKPPCDENSVIRILRLTANFIVLMKLYEITSSQLVSSDIIRLSERRTVTTMSCNNPAVELRLIELTQLLKTHMVQTSYHLSIAGYTASDA